PLSHVLGDIQRLAPGMRLAQRLLTLRRHQGQDPIAYTQLDITIGLGLESRPPIGMLVVVVGMRRMSMKVDEHGAVPLRSHVLWLCNAELAARLSSRTCTHTDAYRPDSMQKISLK